MKRTFLLAVTAASLIGMVGCTKNDQLDAPASKEVGFSTYVNANTKGLAKTEFAIGDNFAVMATRSVNTWTPDDATWFMGGGTDQFITVTNTPSPAGASLWKYNPVVLWPESEAVSFFAFSPAPTATDKHGIADVTAVKGSPTLKFEVNADIKQQVDLLRAEALDKFEEEIQLQFGHALTKVSFAAKAQVTANQRVRLDAIKLVGIKNTGELQLYNKDRKLGALEDMGGWSNQAGSVAYAPALSHEVVGEVPTTLTAMTAEDQTLFMIPQEFTLNGGANLEVTYSYSHDGGQKWINGSILKIDLGETTKYWNPGKSYRYVLTLAPADIYDFSADIIEWNDKIDVTVGNPFSVKSLEVDFTGGLPVGIDVTDVSGEAFGYTLKSGDDTWLKIADNADGNNAAGEIVYNSDGTTITKTDYEVKKKWYVVVQPNMTGIPRETVISLIRTGADDITIPIYQQGTNPFKACVLKDMAPVQTVHKIDALQLPDNAGMTHKLKTTETWFTMSLDGVGAGTKEISLAGNPGDVVSFYVHTTDNLVATRDGVILFESTNKDGVARNVAKTTIKQLLIEPFKDCDPSPLCESSNSTKVYELKNITAPIAAGCTYKITTTSNWYSISLDGQGAGTKEVVVSQSDTPVSLYVHSSRNITLDPRQVNLTFSAISPTKELAIGTFMVSQPSPAANSYISYPESGTYKTIVFSALEKPVAKYSRGNSSIVNTKGNNPATTDAALSNDIVYQSGDKLEVVWQTAVNHGTGGAMVIKSLTLAANGTATVQVNGPGNAVVAYKRGGTILWAYHIWATDSNPFSNHYSTGSNVNGTAQGGSTARFMDRNVGALSATTSQPASGNAYKYFGLYFQHGRPTPFTGQGTGTTISRYTRVYGPSGNALNSSDTDDGYFIKKGVAASSVTEALQNLNTHYYQDLGGLAWYRVDKSIWSDYGVSKSIYDPCPYGYRVPNKGSWIGFTVSPAGQSIAVNAGSAWSGTWWPAAGSRRDNTGYIFGFGEFGNYWVSSPVSGRTNYSHGLYFNYNGTYQTADDQSGRAWSYPVRCVQEGY